MNLEKEQEWTNNAFYSFVIMCHLVLIFIVVCFYSNDKVLFGLSLYALIIDVAWFIKSLVMMFKLEHDNTYCMNDSITGKDIPEDVFKLLDDVEKEIEMKDFSINKCICQFVDEKENWLLDEVIKEIKDHPETYGDWDFYIMNREKLKELLDKGACYDYDIERGNRILNDNIKVINEFSTALSKLKCICLEFIHDYDTRVKLMDAYNVSDFVVIENLKILVEDFKNEFERIGN